ncbi:hypothetical protein DFS34DRAFT_603427 [Phlyctochytrium arcticum]|nr:hypothetical protein DFS34DRAFT_603427 [Phlyctochytrium arcticum]
MHQIVIRNAFMPAGHCLVVGTTCFPTLFWHDFVSPASAFTLHADQQTHIWLSDLWSVCLCQIYPLETFFSYQILDIITCCLFVLFTRLFPG